MYVYEETTWGQEKNADRILEGTVTQGENSACLH